MLQLFYFIAHGTTQCCDNPPVINAALSASVDTEAACDECRVLLF